jgi:hypothetical protein
VALASVVSALDSDVAMTNDRFETLSLITPEKLAKTIADPPDGSRTYRFSGGSSKSAKVCHGEVRVAVKT